MSTVSDESIEQIERLLLLKRYKEAEAEAKSELEKLCTMNNHLYNHGNGNGNNNHGNGNHCGNGFHHNHQDTSNNTIPKKPVETPQLSGNVTFDNHQHPYNKNNNNNDTDDYLKHTNDAHHPMIPHYNHSASVPLMSLLIQAMFELGHTANILNQVSSYYGSIQQAPFEIVFMCINLKATQKEYALAENLICTVINQSVEPMSTYSGSNSESNGNNSHNNSTVQAEGQPEQERSRLTQSQFEDLVELLVMHVYLPSGQVEKAVQYIRKNTEPNAEQEANPNSTPNNSNSNIHNHKIYFLSVAQANQLQEQLVSQSKLSSNLTAQDKNLPGSSKKPRRSMLRQNSPEKDVSIPRSPNKHVSWHESVERGPDSDATNSSSTITKRQKSSNFQRNGSIWRVFQAFWTNKLLLALTASLSFMILVLYPRRRQLLQRLRGSLFMHVWRLISSDGLQQQEQPHNPLMPTIQRRT